MTCRERERLQVAIDIGRGRIQLRLPELQYAALIPEIDWLVRKAGAFEDYQYRDKLFPSSRFRMAFDSLHERYGARGSKEHLRTLELAAKE